MDGVVPPAGGEKPDPAALSGGGQHASGGRRAHGGAVGPAGGGEPPGGPRFDQPVPPGGYAWWYVDALSDDGRTGLTLIAFIGSVFSPYYARARRSGPADPLDHCALNVALYGHGRKRWAMTERGRGALHRTTSSLRVGPSSLRWDDDTLTIDIDEITVPLPSRLRGRVRLYPDAVTTRSVVLDRSGRHRWRPIAPCGRVEVAFESPAVRWSGAAYFDCNDGDEPLERAFVRWDWSRASLRQGTAVLYDVERRDAGDLALAMRFDAAGAMQEFAPPRPARLPRTGWNISRATRADSGLGAVVLRTLEDGPFYARSVLATRLLGEPVTAVHESLSLDRFDARWVQTLLPFRMPRAWR
jgi:carotenoid 1,2-hydratase